MGVCRWLVDRYISVSYVHKLLIVIGGWLLVVSCVCWSLVGDWLIVRLLFVDGFDWSVGWLMVCRFWLWFLVGP